MTDQPATPELNKALAAFQAELPTVAKGDTGKVEGTNKQGKQFSYEYKYAGLDDVSAAAMPSLGKHGLSFTAPPTTSAEGKFVLAYSLRHSSGEEISGEYPLWLMLPDKVTAQLLGGLITYARRYVFCAVTGIAPGGDDTDGAATAVGGRAKTAWSDPEHRRLTQREPRDRVEGTRRANGGEPDLWDGQPAGEFKAPETSLPDRRAKPHTPAQMIAAHWRRLGITDDEERHNWTARMAGVDELAHTTDLPVDRQRAILAALAQCKDIGKVQEWIDEQAGVPS